MVTQYHCTIVRAKQASGLECLAAKEIRRYLYLRTGVLLPIVVSDDLAEASPSIIVVAQKDRPIVMDLAGGPAQHAATSALLGQQYLLKTTEHDGSQVLLIVGGDSVGVLYGAYRFAEHIGVRFYLHADVIPDERITLDLPQLDELGKPLFDLRGILPFHDFAEGPDLWDADDYKAVLAQLAKLRMNFIGLHTYPEGPVGPEPTVWVGLSQDIGPNGHVAYSYPSAYMNSLRGQWDYAPKKTSDYSFGAAQLFEQDDYGGGVMAGMMPFPQTAEQCNEVFRRTARMLNDAFVFAHNLGIRTCVGTETPLTIPKRVQERLAGLGKLPAEPACPRFMGPSWVMRGLRRAQQKPDPALVQELYEGVFRRIMQAYPIDYYWLWTPELWIWPDVGSLEVQAIEADLKAATVAADKVQAPFRLAISGWVLGPPGDRALFDRMLPKHMPLACINLITGKAPVEPGFADVQNRPKWAIPWPEDDGCLTSPQLWVGRMRKDAADSLTYGCTGLMGNHWRTRIIAPNVLALAWAAWDQSGWKDRTVTTSPTQQDIEIVDGRWSSFTSSIIQGTDEPAVYQTMEYGITAYRLKLPNGPYKVTLKFCEPWFSTPGKRIFGVKLQGTTVIKKLDIAAQAGNNRALDYTFENVAVTTSVLDIEFEQIVNMPVIAGIVVEGDSVVKKINCGGYGYGDYASDVMPNSRNRYSSSDDFYADWTLHEFGPKVAAATARIFQSMDGNLHELSTWEECPGAISINPMPWSETAKLYSFVDELAELEPLVHGAGNQERFSYWLNHFRFMRAMARVGCLLGDLCREMRAVEREQDAGARREMAQATALPLRRELLQQWADMMSYLLAVVDTPGEVGMVMNIEQHTLEHLQRLTMFDDMLEAMLGQPLPADLHPWKDYRGPARVIVPTKRTNLAEKEDLKLKVIVLARQSPTEAALFWRPLGQGTYRKANLIHVARGVCRVQIPAELIAGNDLEYYVRVCVDGQDLYWPITAPHLNHAVVVSG